jgi:hypothetical protein
MVSIITLVLMFLVCINNQLLNEFAFEKVAGYAG